MLDRAADAIERPHDQHIDLSTASHPEQPIERGAAGLDAADAFINELCQLPATFTDEAFQLGELVLGCLFGGADPRVDSCSRQRVTPSNGGDGRKGRCLSLDCSGRRIVRVGQWSSL